MRKLAKSKTYRDEHSQFLCDGKKLLEEALSSGVVIDIVLTTECLEYTFPDYTRVYLAHKDLIDSISPLQTSQGLLFAGRIPGENDCGYSTGTHILLDSIQDPGNVGTIIRTALAFGIKSVILTEETADIYNPKTVRASMGAVFKQHLKIKAVNEITELKKSGVRFIGTSNDSASIDIKLTNLNNSIIILGNEGQGISDNLLSLCDEVITIPLAQGCESLNVAAAAAIVMWEARLGSRE
jgi:TrmH family RNA methyltransferase